MIEGGIQSNIFMMVEVYQIILAQRLRCTNVCTDPQIIFILNTVFVRIIYSTFEYVLYNKTLISILYSYK